MTTTDRIDIHAHGFPEAYLRGIAGHYPGAVRLQEADSCAPLRALWSGVPIPAWDLERRIDEMKRDSVRIEVLSAPTIYGQMDEHTADYCRMLNDFQAEVVGQAPERFRSLIHLPVHDMPAALAELERWAPRSECAGVVFGSNMGGLYPGDAALLPLWEAIDRAGLAVLVHPVSPPAHFGPLIPPILMFPFDSTTAAASILYSGLFDRFPDLKIIISHLGGTIAFLRERLDMALDIAGLPPKHGQDLAERPSAYLERFYVDTAQGFHRPAFDCACAVFGADHLVYGSDHFHVDSQWRRKLNHFLDDLPLSAQERQALLIGTAEKLLR